MADAAMCPTHPTERALGNCTRCGAFICNLDSRLLEGQLYCTACASRPDVDWLEAFRLKHWGKRDGWAWMFGVGALINFAAGIALMLQPESRPAALFLFAAAAGGALWWAKVKAARYVMLGLIIVEAIYFSVVINPGVAVGNIVPLLIMASVVIATRTKLFFEIDVSRDELKKMWDLYANNQVARYALSMGILGLIVWPFAPLALLCGVIGLSRVDPTTRPPIGRKGSAIAGIVLGVLGIGICSVAIGTGWFR